MYVCVVLCVSMCVSKCVLSGQPPAFVFALARQGPKTWPLMDPSGQQSRAGKPLSPETQLLQRQVWVCWAAEHPERRDFLAGVR